MLTRQDVPANEFIASQPDQVVWAKVIGMPKGWVDSWHHHTWHQLIFPVKGVVQTQATDVTSVIKSAQITEATKATEAAGCYSPLSSYLQQKRQFLVPHTSALFVPAGVRHESVALTETRFIGLYINPSFGRRYSDRLKPVSMTPFLKSLILLLHQECQKWDNGLHSQNDEERDKRLRLLDVLYDQVHQEESYSYSLLIPQDRRIRQIFDQLTDAPSLDWSLAKWGAVVGASERTLSRLFVKEFNTSFALWRQQLRLIYSLSLLDAGVPVQAVAHQVGYQNDSSYIKAFKIRFGITPGQFCQSSEVM
ncbi:hypothetical protein ABT57_08195 [Photobacterium ganghwense]|uniref:HTH araC/xylS-type domain-containing protein n=1 Tax=Photobacterium ganghwense TaxID=320778 RepID=A0A0J1HFV1_9GAMM|nr:helix-turn-helix transcriptional regulator [Photobacterium ganghwense]KLV10508.1 hypothetical protein ABT57_08195 [Photobacterium ganghwense]